MPVMGNRLKVEPIETLIINYEDEERPGEE